MGLNIPQLGRAFASEQETIDVQAAVERAQARLQQFCNRLSHDAAMLAGLMRAMQPAEPCSDREADPTVQPDPDTQPEEEAVEAAPADGHVPEPDAPRDDMFAEVPFDDGSDDIFEGVQRKSDQWA
jgi:hypothetical protein